MTVSGLNSLSTLDKKPCWMRWKDSHSIDNHLLKRRLYLPHREDDLL